MSGGVSTQNDAQEYKYWINTIAAHFTTVIPAVTFKVISFSYSSWNHVSTVNQIKSPIWYLFTPQSQHLLFTCCSLFNKGQRCHKSSLYCFPQLYILQLLHILLSTASSGCLQLHRCICLSNTQEQCTYCTCPYRCLLHHLDYHTHLHTICLLTMLKKMHIFNKPDNSRHLDVIFSLSH